MMGQEWNYTLPGKYSIVVAKAQTWDATQTTELNFTINLPTLLLLSPYGLV